MQEKTKQEVKTERNRNIDIIRALAILIILVYHIFAITNVKLVNGNLRYFVQYGGEYGVTVFFIISGFSIYKSLSRRKDNFKYGTFIKDRLKRILPQYYISLIILILFTGSTVVLFSKEQIWNLLSHVFLAHGFFYSHQGSISGVAWTLTPIFCFYLFAPLLFKCLEKKPKLTVCLSILVSCIIKAIIFNFLAITNTQDAGIYFWLGRIFFCEIDEFVIGMFLAKSITTPENNKDKKKLVINILLILVSVVMLYLWIFVDKNKVGIITANTTRLSNCFEAYIWYSVLTIILSLGIYGFSQIRINLENPVSKGLLNVAKHEYGIYIWHLEVIKFLSMTNPYLMQLVGQSRRIVYVYLFVIAIVFGILMDVIVESVDWEKQVSKIKSLINIKDKN